mgnify:CR=1 FL=1
MQKYQKIPYREDYFAALATAAMQFAITKVINKVGKSGVKWYEVGKNIYFYLLMDLET